MEQRHFQTPFSPKPIPCILYPSPSAAINHDAKNVLPSSQLIFTHGAGGTLTSDAIANFSLGFATLLPILCFQGKMNLKSRVRMFAAVIEYSCQSKDLEAECGWLGGRSMGARAAVMATAATEPGTITHLVLVSYPLHTTNKRGEIEMRDEILLALAPDMKVVFVSGDGDNMCDLSSLEDVRARMNCKTWRIVVRGADHGMNYLGNKSGKASSELVTKSGEVVAVWMKESIESDADERREGEIFLNEEGKANWSGWVSGTTDPSAVVGIDGDTNDAKPSKDESRRAKRKGGMDAASQNSNGAVATRTRKRQKR